VEVVLAEGHTRLPRLNLEIYQLVRLWRPQIGVKFFPDGNGNCIGRSPLRTFLQRAIFREAAPPALCAR
jgi:hypothetical protein